jgi:hypothetical protein
MNQKNKTNRNLILATGFSIITLFSMMCATFAWFLVPKPNVTLDTVSGDMSISVDKLSAYRYVYPFYKDSNSYIDYSIDSDGKDKGQLKEFVIKNTEEIKALDSVPTIQHDDSFTKTALYLVGDHTYLGETTSTEFSLSSGLIFSSSTSALEFTISDVNLSIGSHFAVARNDGTIVEFTGFTGSDNIIYSNSHFTCKKAGLYDFKITKSSTASDATYTMEITYDSRDDESILGMTLFDPTYALLNGKTNTLEGRASAIYEQNTCLIYDVEISVKNQTRNFQLSLDVKRKELSDDTGKYTSSSSSNQYCLSKYVTYRYKEYEENDTVADLFESTFHSSKDGTIYNKPDSYTQDTTTLETTSSDDADSSSSMNVLTFDDSSTTSLSLFKDKKPTSYDSESTKFHFYIAVDYSPVAIEYFFEENQLSKVYDLIRDYTFYFSSSQIVSDGGNA